VKAEELLRKLLGVPGLDACRAMDADGNLIGHLAAIPVDIAPTTRPRCAATRARRWSRKAATRCVRPGERGLRALYARVSERLVADRRLVHYGWVPAGDTATAPGPTSGFGRESTRN